MKKGMLTKLAKFPIYILSFTIFTLIVLFAIPFTSHGTGSTDLFIDTPTWIAVDNTFTLTVRVETDRDSLVSLEISYDGDAMECLSINPPSESSDDGRVIRIVPLSAKTSHKYECRFKVKKAGAATFKAVVVECGGLDGNPLPTPTLEKTVNGYVPTPSPTPTATPTNIPTATPSQTPSYTPITPSQTPSYTPFHPTTNPSATPSSEREFIYDGTMYYIAEDYEVNSVEIPAGFEKSLFKYMDKNISGAQNPSRVRLIYATDVLGNNGTFFVFVNNATPLKPYLEISYNGNNYVFITFDEKPDNLTETDFMLGEHSVDAYVTNNELYKDFIVLYGFKSGGELSYYLFDTTEGTLQRCMDPSVLEKSEISGDITPTQTPANPSAGLPTQTSDPKVYPNESNFTFDQKTILLIIIAICIFAIIIAGIIIAVRSKRISKNYEDDDDYYSPDEFLSNTSVPEMSNDDIQEETATEAEPENTENTENEKNAEAAAPAYNLSDLDDDVDDVLHLGND